MPVITSKPDRTGPTALVACHSMAAAAVVAFVGLLPIDQATAADWSAVPRVTAAAEYNDNKRLRPGAEEEIETTGFSIDAALSLEYRTPISSLRVVPRLRSLRFDESEFDSDDQFLAILGSREGRQSEIGFDANYARESIFTAELSNAEFDDFVDEQPEFSDTGQLVGEARRERLRVRPYLDYELSELWEWGVQLELLAVDYEDDPVVDRTSFDSYLAETSLERQWGERSTIGAAVFFERYEAEDFFNESDSAGVDIIYERQFTETLTGRFTVGAQRTEADFETTGGTRESSSDTSGRGSVQLTGTREVFEWELNLGRNIYPSSSGALEVRDEIRLILDRRFSARLSGSLGFRAFRTEAAGGTQDRSTDRDYVRGTLGMDFQMARSWYLTARYDYTWQDRENRDSADANQVRIGVEYRPMRQRR